MKIFSNHISKALALTGVLFLGSCELTDLDINVDPNNPAKADLNLLLTNAQYQGFDTFAGSTNSSLHYVMNMMGDQGASRFDLSNNTFNGTWNFLYATPLKDLDEMIALATEQNNPTYLGIGQAMKAYYFSVMVDLWGDVPYTEGLLANKDAAIKAPKFDEGKAIYANLLKLLDEATANLNKTGIAVRGDLVYSGNVARWKKAVNSIKFRLLLNMARTDADAKAKLLAMSSADMISSSADDMVFNFSKDFNSVNDYRHPWFRASYGGTEAAYYISHQYMVEMLENDDPRFPMYFKRQTATILRDEVVTERNTQPCSNQPGCVYGYLINNQNVIDRLYTAKGKTYGDTEKKFLAGIFGRDRGDGSGLPADGSLRTVHGPYPAGGQHDSRPVGVIGGNRYAGGNGVFPIITSWSMNLYKAEAALGLGFTGDAATYLEKALREQLAFVSTRAKASDDQTVTLTAGEIDTFVASVMKNFNAASDNSSKMNVLMKQAWFMYFGNGIEMYNAFRRTGAPGNLQEPITRVRNFPLRLPLGSSEINLNANAPKGAYNEQAPVFWDAVKYKY